MQNLTIVRDSAGKYVLTVFDENGSVIKCIDLPSEETIELRGGEYTKEFIDDVKNIHGVTIKSH